MLPNENCWRKIWQNNKYEGTAKNLRRKWKLGWGSNSYEYVLITQRSLAALGIEVYLSQKHTFWREGLTGTALGTQSWLKIWKQEPVWQLLMGEMVSKNNMPKMIWNMLKIVWNMVKVIWNMPKIMSIFDNVLHSSSLARRRWRVWWV